MIMWQKVASLMTMKQLLSPSWKHTQMCFFDPILHGRSKHIDVKYHFLRDLTNDGVINLIYYRSEDQIADILTKPLKFPAFQKLRKLLGVCTLNDSIWGMALQVWLLLNWMLCLEHQFKGGIVEEISNFHVWVVLVFRSVSKFVSVCLVYRSLFT